MRNSVKAALGWLTPVAFLLLPNCGFQAKSMPFNLNQGPQPWGDAVFCDVENKDAPRHCATADEVTSGIPLTQAAVALVKGQSSMIGLDYSPTSIAALGCSPGQPVAITFSSPFPTGTSRCLNCGAVIGPVYVDVNAACVDVCRDMTVSGDAFCADPANIHQASTNASGCFNGACVNSALPMGFVDPRATPEPVIWTSLVGVAVSGADSNTLTKTAATTGNFDAGAASVQTITHGDGYVEFTASETTTGRICGLSTGAPDSDPTQLDIGFGFNVTAAGTVRIVENGAAVTAPGGTPDFASYASGDRLRVSVADHFDNTATVTYTLIPSSCSGESCAGMVLRTVGGAAYPLRVDASFNHQGGTLTDVRIVRIK